MRIEAAGAEGDRNDLAAPAGGAGSGAALPLAVIDQRADPEEVAAGGDDAEPVGVGGPRPGEAGARGIADEAGTTLLEMSFLEALYLPVEPVTDPYRRRPVPREFGAPRTPRTLLSAAIEPIRRFAAARMMRGPE